MTELPEWGKILISSLGGTAAGFGLILLKEKRTKEEARKQVALTNHFNQEITQILRHIGECSGLTIVTKRNNELVFESNDVLFHPIEKPFQTDAQEEAFKVHFPFIAGKWEKLYQQALQLKSDNENGEINEGNLQEVSQALKKLSKTTKSTLENINKNNRIGTRDFKHNKKCPICKNF